MKTWFKPSSNIVIAALACLFLSNLTSVAASNAGTGQLTIRRSANFGANLYVDVWIDGTRVNRITRGHSYIGSLPAGTHEVKVVVPSKKLSNSATTQLKVEAGKSYQLTALWQGQTLVLK